ncbi:type-F conjugative transfer system secretin TraK [Modicisalibacter sp. MOD 31.J]|uniref:TraK domain-containing protein n=1 Tax=Modicisalibacter sp. MOD 31.J TaxID=2831897 RepID=UPI001CCAF719|nr:type-F conjugative transfer system secretin TraK [Modicisalibacter sp. MOD 31.J]
MGLVGFPAVAGGPGTEPGDTPHPIVGATLPGLTLPTVDTRPVHANPASKTDATHSSPDPRKQQLPTRNTVALVPGVNQVIKIARGHLNRIITPFENPVVHTTSTAKVNTEGQVLYVASQSSSPSTLYVSPEGQRDLALSITLLPRGIAPREVRLSIAGAPGRVYASAARAGEWERSRPYVHTIKDAVSRLALGEVPPGYGLREWRSSDAPMNCAQPGIEVNPGQVLSGSELILLVGTATNNANERLEIEEATCRRAGVLAVAAWPKASLAPGERTELYIVMRRALETVESRQRPSLIGNTTELVHE